MPDKKTRGSDQGRGVIKSRSAQSGPPDDKPRDRTQRGDLSGPNTQGGKQRAKETRDRNPERRQTRETDRDRSGRNTGGEK